MSVGVNKKEKEEAVLREREGEKMRSKATKWSNKKTHCLPSFKSIF